MGYVLAAILLLTSVFSVGLCRSNSHVSPINCNGQVGLQAVSTSPCRWYIDCVLNPDGTITAYHERCTQGLLFDPVNKVCANIAVPGKASGGSRRLVKRQAPPAPQPDCTKKTISCGGTCNTLRICSQAGVDKFIWKYDIACKGTTPFCQEGKAPTCVSKVPENCDSGFPCLEEGTYPDLNDCTVYHNCYPSGDVLKDMQAYCDPGMVYSGDIEGCRPSAVATDCHKASCPAGAYGIAPFPLEPRYYIVCEAGVPKYVSKCPKNKEFTANRQCEVVCKAAGKMVDPDGTGCKTYIDCVPTTTTGPPYKPTVKNCPGTQLFSPITLTCGSAACP